MSVLNSWLPVLITLLIFSILLKCLSSSKAGQRLGKELDADHKARTVQKIEQIVRSRTPVRIGTTLYPLNVNVSGEIAGKHRGDKGLSWRGGSKLEGREFLK